MTIDAAAAPCRPKAVSLLIHQLDQEAALGCDWWETETAGLILGLLATGPAATVFLAIAQLLCEGEDSDVIVGSPSANAAFAVASEWLDAKVEPNDVATWLRAGCWKPTAASAMADHGVQPDRLLKDDGQPLHWVDLPTADSERVPPRPSRGRGVRDSRGRRRDAPGDAMTRRTPLRAELLGSSGGPSGWVLTAGTRARKNVSLEALVCLEHQLRADGDVDAANDLYLQVTKLAGVAEAWRRNTNASQRPLEKTGC